MRYFFIVGMLSGVRETAVSVLFLLMKSRCRGSGKVQQDACLCREKKAMANASACCLSSCGR